MGGRGAGLGGGGNASTPSTNVNVSPSSTGGRIVDQGGGQWYGENDNGYAVSILDGGSDDINMFRYGSRQVYEVSYHSNNTVNAKQTDIATTKTDAMRLAKKWLTDNK